jgi:O-antigen/teichoic acid export membrane protein
MAWSQLGRIAEVGLTLLIAVVVVRTLAPAQFGTYSVLTNLAGIVMIVVPVVMVEALGAVLPRYPAAGQRVYFLVVVAAIRAAIVLAFVAVLIPLWPYVRDALNLDAVSLWLLVLAGGYWLTQDVLYNVSGWYAAELDLRPVAMWNVVGRASSLVLLGVLAAADEATVTTVLAAVAGGYVVTIAGLATGLRQHGVARAPRVDLRFVLGFTTKTWLLGLLGYVLATQVDVLLVGALKNAREAGFYAAAATTFWRAQLLFVAGWTVAMVPALGAALARGGREALVRAWGSFAALWLFVTVPISALVIPVADSLVRVVFGADYAPVGRLLVWVAVANLCIALAGGTLGVNALWVVDAQGLVLRIRVVTALLNLVLALVLIPRHGALGAVVATGVAATLGAAAELVGAARLTGVSYPFVFAAKVAAAAALAAAPGVLIRPGGAAGIVVALAAGVAVYFAVALVLRPFGKEAVAVLASVSPRLARSPLRFFAAS